MLAKYIKLSLTALVLSSLFACGGSSGSSGKLIEGTLMQGSGTTHRSALDSVKHDSVKHSADTPIEEVEICALGKCSRTDGKGQWGFFVENENFQNDILFTINGHGINTSTALSLTNIENINDLFIHFEHNHGTVIIHHLEINGERVAG